MAVEDRVNNLLVGKAYKAPWTKTFLEHRSLWWLTDLSNLETITLPEKINEQIWDLVEIHQFLPIAIKRFESQFYMPKATTPRHIKLINCVNVVEGDKIKNIDTNEYYTIEKVYRAASGLFSGYVYLSSGASSLEETHVIELPENRQILFFHDFPSGEGNRQDRSAETPEKVEQPFRPTITYRVIHRTPAALGGAPFSGKSKDLVSSYLKSINDTEDPSYVYDIYNQFWDNIVQYNVWSASQMYSDYLIVIFERFLSEVVPILKYYNVQAAYHRDRQDDRFITRWRPDIVSRTLNFFYRTQQVTVVRERLITDIGLSVNVDS